MPKHKQKSENQARNDWVRRRQNIARGMKIALYEINQQLKPLGLMVDFPPGFTARTVALAEAGRLNTSEADQDAAFIYRFTDGMRERGYDVIPL